MKWDSAWLRESLANVIINTGRMINERKGRTNIPIMTPVGADTTSQQTIFSPKGPCARNKAI